MAQTKRKRQTKHRGNAAGVVESRGRTGRKPTAAEKKGEMGKAKAQAVDRRDRPPTWRGAFIKGMFAAVVLLLFSLFALKSKSGSFVALFPIVLVMYTVISYYTDRLVFNRRQRNKAKRAAGKAPSR
jgi:hypothetical protein